MNGSVESFKHCKQLIDLDLTFSELSEDFFNNIESFAPNLKLLFISSEKEFSELFIDAFQSMKNLQNVCITYNNKEEKKTHINEWYFGKRLDEVMSCCMRRKVIRINDNCGLISHEEDIPNLDLGSDSE